MANFAAPAPARSPDARDVPRLTMTQPNCYWTLTSSLVTVVGLYSNVPENGYIDPDQAAWLAGELAHAPADRPLIVTSHHPALSLDRYHGGSAPMLQVIDAAIAASGRVPTLVAGAGGYWHLYAAGRRATRVLCGRSARLPAGHRQHRRPARGVRHRAPVPGVLAHPRHCVRNLHHPSTVGRDRSDPRTEQHVRPTTRRRYACCPRRLPAHMGNAGHGTSPRCERSAPRLYSISSSRCRVDPVGVVVQVK
jgi:hypothetical protein